MELALITYLITIIQGIEGFFLVVGFVSGLVSLAILLWGLLESPKLVKKLWFTVPIFLVASFMIALIPEKKDAYIILGAYVTQEIATNPNTIEIGTKLLNVVNKNLDEILAKKVVK